jgi:general secretion pathway protein B
MSYILDALKKADLQRTAGNVPDLETVHWREPAARKTYRWLWVLAALFLLNGAAIMLLAVRHDTGKPAGEQRAALSERGAAGRNAASATAPVEPVPAVPTPPAATRSAPQPRGRVVVPRPASPPARAAIPHNPVVAAPKPAAAPSPPPRPVAAAAQPQASGRLPDWDELPLDFRKGFALPRVDVHVYDTNPQLRFVLIDLQKYRQGDRLPNGAVLEKILPEGIQLSYQGRSFIYKK